MCDYGSWEAISKRRSKTRRVHECVACCIDYPAGTVMNRFTGRFEGDFQCYYNCDACIFMAQQDEDSPLHVCAGDVGAAEYEARAVYDYVRMCLEEGLEPIATVAQMMRDGWVSEQLEEVAP